jgi:hypothetical protein
LKNKKMSMFYPPFFQQFNLLTLASCAPSR